MNNISFQGNITVTSWEKAKSVSSSFTSSKVQDKLLNDIAKSFGQKGDVIPLSKQNSQILLKIFEKIIGKPINKNVNNEKFIYNNGDMIIFSDKNPALYDGVRIEVGF